MEPLKISDIFKKTVISKTKRKFDEQEEQSISINEYSMPKIQKLHKSKLFSELSISNHQETHTQIPRVIDYFYQLEELDLELFLKEISTIPAADYTIPSKLIKNDKTLAELNYICDKPSNKPIKKSSTKEDDIVEIEIQKIQDSLKKISKSNSNEYKNKYFEKSETILIKNLKILFNSLIFRNNDFSRSEFNPESATILYKHLYKVNIHISKTKTKEFKIYFGFPFYLSIHINIFGKILIERKNIYKLLEDKNEIQNIHYYSTNTGFNTLDLITTSKFINLITNNYYLSGFDLLKNLLNLIEHYSANTDKLIFNEVSINFEKFVILYTQVIKNITIVPFCY
jgi:hypothetical protein